MICALTMEPDFTNFSDPAMPRCHWEGGVLVFPDGLPIYTDERGLTRLMVDVVIEDLPMMVDSAILDG